MSDLTDDRLAEMISQTDHAGMWEVVRALLELQRHRRDVANRRSLDQSSSQFAELFEDGRKPGSGQSRPRAKATQEGAATSSQGATAQGAVRSAGNVAEPQISPTPDRIDHLPSSPISERIGAAPRCHQDPSIDAAWLGVVTEACAAHSGHELLTVALRDVISIMDGIGGYLTPEDQQRLWHARQLAGMTP